MHDNNHYDLVLGDDVQLLKDSDDTSACNFYLFLYRSIVYFF